MKDGDPVPGATVFDLAEQLGIGDLEKFLRACIANAAMMAGIAGQGRAAQKITYTVEEAADLIGVSPRWLADECRAERVDHVHLARHRYFTHGQVLQLLEDYAVERSLDNPIAPHVARVMRRIQKDRNRPDGRRPH